MLISLMGNIRDSGRSVYSKAPDPSDIKLDPSWADKLRNGEPLHSDREPLFGDTITELVFMTCITLAGPGGNFSATPIQIAEVAGITLQQCDASLTKLQLSQVLKRTRTGWHLKKLVS